MDGFSVQHIRNKGVLLETLWGIKSNPKTSDSKFEDVNVKKGCKVRHSFLLHNFISLTSLCGLQLEYADFFFLNGSQQAQSSVRSFKQPIMHMKQDCYTHASPQPVHYVQHFCTPLLWCVRRVRDQLSFSWTLCKSDEQQPGSFASQCR